MAEAEDAAKRGQEARDRAAMAEEGERGTAGIGRKPGTASTDAGAATADEEEAPGFPSTAADQPRRGRGTGIKDAPPSGKLPAGKDQDGKD